MFKVTLSLYFTAFRKSGLSRKEDKNAFMNFFQVHANSTEACYSIGVERERLDPSLEGKMAQHFSNGVVILLSL